MKISTWISTFKFRAAFRFESLESNSEIRDTDILADGMLFAQAVIVIVGKKKYIVGFTASLFEIGKINV